MNNLKKISLGKTNHIYMNKSKKFKSIGFSLVYKMKYDYKNISAFNILAKYLGNCNANYPSIELFNKYIESLYGASVGIKPNYVGSLFTVTFYINFLNPKYVNDDTLIEKAISLLSMLIYEPLLIDDKFDENIINICKETCLIDVESSEEYNMGYVLRKLKAELSNSENSSMSSTFLGNKKVLKSLNNENLLKYYNKLTHSPFDVYVTGDYKFNEVEKLIRKYFTKKGIKGIYYSVFDMIKDKEYKNIIIKKKVSQAKLAVAYKIPILFNDERQYAFKIARLVLSGTLSSKFGKVIREQMGLCYSISANYSAYYGTFIVTTGVASENVDKVIKEIDNQINEVKNGNVSDEEFNQAKEVLLNDLSSVDDTLFGTLNMIKTYHNINKDFDLKDELDKFNNVTKQEVIEVCKLLKYCNYAVLDKE